MKKYFANVIIPFIIVIVVCFVITIFLYDPVKKETIDLEKFLVECRDDKENKVYTNIVMDKFVDESFKEDIGDIDINATLYIYEDSDYKYVEIIPIINSINSYQIAYDKKNDIGIFSNYSNVKQEEIARYYLYDGTINKVYIIEDDFTTTEIDEQMREDYKMQNIEECFEYYLNYKAN